MLCEVFSIMRNLGPHVVDHEWLSKVEFVMRVRHSLEMKCHHGTALHISKLVASNSCIAISIEESCKSCSVFGEVWVIEALLPFLIVVNDMVSFWRKEFSEFFVLEYLIENPDFIHVRFSALVPNSSSCQ